MTTVTTDFYNNYTFKKDSREMGDNHWDCEDFSHEGGNEFPAYKVRIWFFTDEVEAVDGDQLIGTELLASPEKIEFEGDFISFLNREGFLEEITSTYNQKINEAHAA